MATATRAITAEEFLGMDLGEGVFELIEGEIVEMPPAGFEHSILCGSVTLVFGNFGRQSGLGYVASNDSPILTRRDPDTVRGGDVCFYLNATVPREQAGPKLAPAPPVLIVEVLSPSNRPNDMLQKILEYLRAGVRMVWLIDPELHRVIIYRPGDPIPVIYEDGATIENLPELPGFRCTVADFFA